MRHLWLALGGSVVLAACVGELPADEGTPPWELSGSGGAAGQPGGSGGGASGAATGGTGGTGGGGMHAGGAGGSAGKAGKAGASGSSGHAGGAGTAGSSGGSGGVSGSSGQGGAGASGMGGVAGLGGVAGVGGGAGASGGGAAGASGGGTGGQGGAAGSNGCPILYVVPSTYVGGIAGDDANDGCSPTKPLATPAAALGRAKLLSSDGLLREARICAGTWDTHAFTLDFPMSISGGWDCGLWTRKSKYGWPNFSLLDSERTHFVNPSTDPTEGAQSALTISSPQIGKDVVIDGLYILGPGANVSATDAPSAVFVNAASAPTISNCQILGGGENSTPAPTNAGGPGSAAIAVVNASPTIEHDVIRGGAGVALGATGFGSAGIDIRAGGAPHIVENAIGGGTGMGLGMAYGSLGIRAVSAGEMSIAKGNPIEKNAIAGGIGVGQLGTIGVFLSGAGFDLVGNFVQGTRSPSVAPEQSMNLTTTGVHVDPDGASGVLVHLFDNRIYGGDAADGSSSGNASRTGVEIVGVSGEIANNDIHGGGTSSSTAYCNTFAVNLLSTTGIVFHHNTVVIARQNSAAGDLHQGGATGTVLENNVFAAAGSQGNGITSQCVTVDSFASVRNNLFILAGAPLAVGCSTVTSTVAWMEKNIHQASPSALVGGNIRLAPDCTGDAGCVHDGNCTTSDAYFSCIADVIGWDPNATGDQGFGALLSTGWPIRPATSPCPVVHSSLDDHVAVPTDMDADARSSTPSMGASEAAPGASCVCVATGGRCGLPTDCCSGNCNTGTCG